MGMRYPKSTIRKYGMVVLSATIACLMTSVSADASQFFQLPIPENMKEQVDFIVKPLTDLMEPYKVFNQSMERGIPHIHDELGKLYTYPFEIVNPLLMNLDCLNTPEDA